MNPYGFVRLVGDGPQRTKQLRHERFSGYSGRITCRMTAETPLFVPHYRGGGLGESFC